MRSTPQPASALPQPSWRRSLALLALALASSAPAAASAQTLQAQPSSISAASPGFTAQAHLLLQNAGMDDLQQVSLTSFSNDGITAIIAGPTPASLPRNGVLDWPIRLTVPPSAHLPGAVLFAASYTAAGIPHVVYTSIAFPAEGSQKPVDATLEGTPEPVSQQRPGAINLVITNNLDVPVTVAAQAQPATGGLNIPPIGSFQVPAHSVAARPVALTTDFRVTSGTQQAILDVDVQWTRDGLTSRRHFALTKPVIVGVFFESELLKALSIPSFLALPGCLVLFTMQLMLSFGWYGLKNRSNLPNLGITNPGFWVIAFSLSGILVALYYLLTGADCLIGYGINDMAYIWVGSILLGALLFVAIGLYSREWVKDHVLSASDPPAEVLRKMANNHIGTTQPGARFKIGATEYTGYFVENIGDDQTLAWICPRINITWGDQSDDLQKAVNCILNGNYLPGNPGRDQLARLELARLFKSAGPAATLEFDPRGAVPRPFHLKLEAVTAYLPPNVILQEAAP